MRGERHSTSTSPYPRRQEHPNARTPPRASPMNPSTWGAVGVIVAALFALAGAIYTTRTGGRASPYDVVVARVVTLEIQRESDVAKIEALQHKVGELEDGRANDQTEIAGLQRRVVGVIEDRDDLVRYITVLQVWIASGARPPAPRVPEHLADVLPEWIPVDGAEPPGRLDGTD